MDVELMVRGASGLGLLCYFVGMLYFGFILMRARRGHPAVVFIWAIVCQICGLLVMAVMSLAMRLFGNEMMDWSGGRVDWIGIMPSILEGGVVLSSLVGAVALVIAAWQGDRR